MTTTDFVKSLWANRSVVFDYICLRYERIMKVMAIRRATSCKKLSLTGTFAGSISNFTIGRNSIIRDCFMIRYKNGKICIGDYVLISHGVTLLAGEHIYNDKDKFVVHQGSKDGELNIQDDVWIGANATIMSGVTIGKGAVIGAMSLVNKDIPAYEVWGGVPAKFIKKRNSNFSSVS